jgi:diguanylate cyclase (GGDEF)-like protein/hemerythrin-like metal-binding protein
MLSMMLIIAGFKTYFKLKPFSLWFVAYFIVGSLFFFVFIYVYPSYFYRVSTSSITMSLFILDGLYRARSTVKNENKNVQRTVIASLIILIAFFLLRIVFAYTSLDQNDLTKNMSTTAFTTGFFMIFVYNFWLMGSVLLESNSQITSLNKDTRKMTDLAMLDPLTKQFNRHRLEIDMDVYLEKGQRQEVVASLLLMDLDYFKEINDKHGHDVGDRIIVLAAGIISGTLRSEDQLYRWGGDEFLILMPHTDVDGAGRLAQRILEKFKNTNFPTIKKQTLSIGCAQHFPYEPKEAWFKRVDLALYRAKQLGRNRTESWDNSEVLPPTMTKKRWEDLFESGNEMIDSQHKAILELSNELYECLGSGNSAENVDGILDRVSEELESHFMYESSLMKKVGFPLYDEHLKIHKQLLIDYDALRLQLKTGILSLGGFFNFVSERLIEGHILKEDMKFFDYLKSNKS